MIYNAKAIRVLVALLLSAVTPYFAEAEDALIPPKGVSIEKAPSASDAEARVGDDECVVELTLPLGSSVTLQGKGIGDQKTESRSIWYRLLPQGEVKRITLVVGYPSGATSKHALPIEAGHRVQLSALDPKADVPDLVLQTAFSAGLSPGGGNFFDELACEGGGDISTDGTMFATGSLTGATNIYDVSTGRLLRTIRGFRESCSPRFLDNGNTILISYSQFSVLGGALAAEVLYSTSTGKVLASFNETNAGNTVISPTGDLFIIPKREGDGLETTGNDDDERTYALVIDAKTGVVRRKLGPYAWYSGAYSSFSQDGKKVIVGDWHDIHIYDTDSWRRQTIFHYGDDTKASIDRATLCPDSSRLCVVTKKYVSDKKPYAHTVRMLDLSSGKELWNQPEKTTDIPGNLTHMLFSGVVMDGQASLSMFSPDGRNVIANNVVADTVTGKVVYRPTGTAYCFLPAGMLLVGTEPNYQSFVKAVSGEMRLVFLPVLHAMMKCDLIALNTGQRISLNQVPLAISRDATAALMLDKMPSNDYSTGTTSPNDIIAFLSSFSTARVALVNLRTQQPVCRFSGSLWGTAQTHLLPGGERIVYSSVQHTWLVDVVQNKTIGRCTGLFTGHSEDGSRIMTERDGFVYIWKTESGKQIGRFKGAGGILSPCCHYISTDVTPTDDDEHSRILWNVKTGNRVVQSSGYGYYSFTLGGEGLLVEIDNDHCLYECSTGKQLFRIENGPGSGNRPSFSPNGHYFSFYRYVPGPDDSSGKWRYYLFDVKEERHHELDTDGVSFSYDSKWLCADYGIIETKTGKSTLDLEEQRRLWEPVWCSNRAVVLAKRYAENGNDCNLQMFNAEAGTPVAGFKPIDYSDYGITGSRFAFSPDGSYIITISGEGYKTGYRGDDSKIVDSELWDAETGDRLCILGDVTEYSFSKDGQWLNTVDGATGQIHLWDLRVQKEICRLTWMNEMQDWIVTTPEGLFDGSPGARKEVCYRIGGGLNVVPVDSFFRHFYSPGLLAAIMRGERPLPRIEIGQEMPPEIRIVSPVSSGVTEEESVAITAVLEDKGGGIKTPLVKLNDNEYLVDEKPVREGDKMRWRFTIPLIAGVENVIEIHSASADGSWESEPARISLRCEKPKERPELYMVAVGINDYEDGDRFDLQCARNDASALADVFKKRGGAFYGENNVHIWTLLDSKATKKGIQSALEEVAKKAKPKDVFILSLSGHGKTNGERYYFIPYEFQSEGRGFVDDKISEQGLPEDELNDWLAAIPATKRVLIYDTCQSGAALTRNAFEYQKALESLARRSGCHIIAASTRAEDAQELPDVGHGALTYALLAGLGAADRGLLKNRSAPSADGLISAVDWFQFAQEQVPKLTELSGRPRQDIEFITSRSDFPILPTKSKEND